MKRTKLTNFVLCYLKWTGIFMYDIIYLCRLSKTLNDIKDNIDDIKTFSHKNNDVIKGFSKEIFNNRILYKVEVFQFFITYNGGSIFLVMINISNYLYNEDTQLSIKTKIKKQLFLLKCFITYKWNV